MFPGDDSGYMFIKIHGQQGVATQHMEQRNPMIIAKLSTVPELKNYQLTVSDNIIDITLQLFTKQERKKAKLRNIFDVEKEILGSIAFLEHEGLRISTEVMRG